MPCAILSPVVQAVNAANRAGECPVMCSPDRPSESALSTLQFWYRFPSARIQIALKSMKVHCHCERASSLGGEPARVCRRGVDVTLQIFLSVVVPHSVLGDVSPVIVQSSIL